MAPRPRRDELLNTPEKMIDLLTLTGFEPTRAWIEHFEHQWEPDALAQLHITFGRSKRKLESLDPAVQAQFLAQIRPRLLALSPEAFCYRAAVVCCVTRG